MNLLREEREAHGSFDRETDCGGQLVPGGKFLHAVCDHGFRFFLLRRSGNQTRKRNGTCQQYGQARGKRGKRHPGTGGQAADGGTV